MTHFEIGLIALALAVDAFTVGAAVGLSHTMPRQRFRLSFHFGLFQALMPLLGAFAAGFLGAWISKWSSVVAFVLLLFIGGKMIVGTFRNKPSRSPIDPTRGLRLIGLSTAVSIDALAVGFTLGLYGVSILFVITVVGIVAAILTLVGMMIAGKIGPRFGHRAELVAGAVLVGLAIKMLIQ